MVSSEPSRCALVGAPARRRERMTARPLRIALTPLIALAIGGAHPHTAAAEEVAGARSAVSRPWRGGIAAGGFIALTGPADYGLLAAAEIFPGGGAGRLGARVEARSLDEEGIESGILSGGVIYEAAAARPRLALALHGELGVMLPDPRPVAGGGVRVHLWLLGPLALGLDTTATVLIDGLDTELALASALTLALAR